MRLLAVVASLCLALTAGASAVSAAQGIIVVSVKVEGGGSVAPIVNVLALPAARPQPITVLQARAWHMGPEDPNGVYATNVEEGEYLVAVVDVELPKDPQPVLTIQPPDSIKIDGPLGRIQVPAVRVKVPGRGVTSVELTVTAESAAALRAKWLREGPPRAGAPQPPPGQGAITMHLTDNEGHELGLKRSFPGVVVIPVGEPQPLGPDYNVPFRWNAGPPITVPPVESVRYRTFRDPGDYFVAMASLDLTLTNDTADALLVRVGGEVRRIQAVRVHVTAGEDTEVELRLSAESSAAVRAADATLGGSLPGPTRRLPEVGAPDTGGSRRALLLSVAVVLVLAGSGLLGLARDRSGPQA